MKKINLKKLCTTLCLGLMLSAGTLESQPAQAALGVFAMSLGGIPVAVVAAPFLMATVMFGDAVDMKVEHHHYDLMDYVHNMTPFNEPWKAVVMGVIFLDGGAGQMPTIKKMTKEAQELAGLNDEEARSWDNDLGEMINVESSYIAFAEANPKLTAEEYKAKWDSLTVNLAPATLSAMDKVSAQAVPQAMPQP